MVVRGCPLGISNKSVKYLSTHSALRCEVSVLDLLDRKKDFADNPIDTCKGYPPNGFNPSAYNFLQQQITRSITPQLIILQKSLPP